MYKKRPNGTFTQQKNIFFWVLQFKSFLIRWYWYRSYLLPSASVGVRSWNSFRWSGFELLKNWSTERILRLYVPLPSFFHCSIPVSFPSVAYPLRIWCHLCKSVEIHFSSFRPSRERNYIVLAHIVNVLWMDRHRNDNREQQNSTEINRRTPYWEWIDNETIIDSNRKMFTNRNQIDFRREFSQGHTFGDLSKSFHAVPMSCHHMNCDGRWSSIVCWWLSIPGFNGKVQVGAIFRQRWTESRAA